MSASSLHMDLLNHTTECYRNLSKVEIVRLAMQRFLRQGNQENP